MRYVGIYTQQRSNNIKSMLLLLCFPGLILVLLYAFLAIMEYLGGSYTDQYGDVHSTYDAQGVNYAFLQALPWVVGIVAVWFLVAYFSNTGMIRRATGARPLQRRENPRVYNIVENLCMTCGMDMPQINVVDDPMLNAFASGIDRGSYTITVTTGLCDRLDDDELAGVIGHELTHIRNRDTRLLIVSIIFVGIMSTVLHLVTRMLWNTFVYGGGGRRSRGDKKGGVAIIVVMLVAVVLAALGYLFTILTRFAISRSREYMADAGGAELCGDPMALASALRKISSNPGLGHVERQDVAQLFICRPDDASSGISVYDRDPDDDEGRQQGSSFADSLINAFSTHPSTASRIAYLEQF